MTKLRQGHHTTPELNPTYTIGTLATLTGISQHTIRAWEKRYNALTPQRSEANRRVYGDHDLVRLSLLIKMTNRGHSIGQIAHLPTEKLKELDSNNRLMTQSPIQHAYPQDAVPYLEACRSAIRVLDADALHDALVRGNAGMGIAGLLDGVVIPLISDIERGWDDGSIRISQEHLASAVLRTFLDRVRASMPGQASAPRLLVTTPRHQQHEIGALMVSIVAATQAWSVTYLGCNLPAEEIAHAARICSVKAIGLSLVFPLDDLTLSSELRLLRKLVGNSLSIVVGGRATGHYQDVLHEIGAEVSTDLWSLRETLRRLALTEAA